MARVNSAEDCGETSHERHHKQISAYSLIVLLLSGVKHYWGEDKPVPSLIVSRFVLRLARNPLFIFGSTSLQVKNKVDRTKL